MRMNKELKMQLFVSPSFHKYFPYKRKTNELHSIGCQRNSVYSPNFIELITFGRKMTYKRKKYHRGDTHLKKGWRTKRRTKDLDEIDEDLKDKNVKTLLNQEVDLDKPGAAQFYCVHCARYFINNTALQDHFTTKVHKRRLKALELEPYSIEDSERAAGKGNYIAPQKRKIETITRDNFNMDTDSEFASKSKLAKIDA